MKKYLSRRNFIRNSAGAFGCLLLAGCASGGEKRKASPNDRLRVAFIGVGGRGAAIVKDLVQCPQVEPVAFCDVDDSYAVKSYRLAPKLPKFSDYRVMFDKMSDDIDAVVIATPDHSHYPIATWAMLCGKSIYLEKPMTRTVWESRKLRDIAKQTGVVTQLGNQGHGMGWWRDVAEWYKAGVFGEVVEMHNWTDRPIWNQGPYSVPDGKEKIPPMLDYKLWLNVAPDSPYSSKITHFHWRGFRNYGTGAMGDHACHSLDWFYSALDLGMPVKIKTHSSEYSDFGWPKQTRSVFEFAAKGDRPALKLYWYDGAQKPAEVKRLAPDELAKMKNGGAIVGTKETVVCYDQFGSRTMITPREKMVELKKSGALPAQTLPRIKESHARNFVQACLEGKKATSDIVDYASKLNELVLLGTIPTFFPDRELVFDANSGKFTNEPEANKLFMSRYPYKKEFLISESLMM